MFEFHPKAKIENGTLENIDFKNLNREVWKNKDSIKINLNEGGNTIFNKLDTISDKLEKYCYTARGILVSEEQQLKFNDFFSKNQNLYIAILEEDYISTVRRLGLTAFRIMMIFSALRMLETSEIPNGLVCNDVDFNNTHQIIKILLKHGSHVFIQIAQELHIIKPKSRKELFLEELPYKFNRQTYVSIALSLGIPDKTAQAYISRFVKAGILISPGHDQYINPSAPNPETFTD